MLDDIHRAKYVFLFKSNHRSLASINGMWTPNIRLWIFDLQYKGFKIIIPTLIHCVSGDHKQTEQLEKNPFCCLYLSLLDLRWWIVDFFGYKEIGLESSTKSELTGSPRNRKRCNIRAAAIRFRRRRGRHSSRGAFCFPRQGSGVSVCVCECFFLGQMTMWVHCFGPLLGWKCPAGFVKGSEKVWFFWGWHVNSM